MLKKGRRLKRFLGLVRESPVPVMGCIEIITPAKIIGWFFGSNENFNKVKLVLGDNIISIADINIERTDVSSIYPSIENPGFKLILPQELPPLDWSKEPVVHAYSSESSKRIKLTSIKEKNKTGKLIREILMSEQLGADGMVDGLYEEQVIHGWVENKNQLNSCTFWLQAEGIPPLPFIANEYRSDLSSQGIKEKSGFTIDVTVLSNIWRGKEVYCSFDRKGRFAIPQSKLIRIPDDELIGNISVKISKNGTDIINNKSYMMEIEKAPEDLKGHWEALEDFRLYLDKIEENTTRIENLEVIEKNKESKQKTKRFLNIFNKKINK